MVKDAGYGQGRRDWSLLPDNCLTSTSLGLGVDRGVERDSRTGLTERGYFSDSQR